MELDDPTTLMQAIGAALGVLGTLYAGGRWLVGFRARRATKATDGDRVSKEELLTYWRELRETHAALEVTLGQVETLKLELAALTVAEHQRTLHLEQELAAAHKALAAAHAELAAVLDQNAQLRTQNTLLWGTLHQIAPDRYPAAAPEYPDAVRKAINPFLPLPLSED